MQITIGAKFAGGQLVVTAAALNATLSRGLLDLTPLVRRHFAGDWGDIDDEDRAANDQALTTPDEGFMSVYHPDPNDPTFRIWIITDLGRAATTVLLPEDY